MLRHVIAFLILAVVVAAILLVRPIRVGLLIILGIGLFAWLGHRAYGLWLRWRWDRTEGAAGKRILLVYSRSPHWQSYIEEQWLPRLTGQVVLLNWSDRATWPRRGALEVQAFRYWSGDHEFNPIAILFPSRGRVRAVRFWQAFRDFRHGKDQALRQAEAELFGFAREVS